MRHMSGSSQVISQLILVDYSIQRLYRGARLLRTTLNADIEVIRTKPAEPSWPTRYTQPHLIRTMISIPDKNALTNLSVLSGYLCIKLYEWLKWQLSSKTLCKNIFPQVLMCLFIYWNFCVRIGFICRTWIRYDELRVHKKIWLILSNVRLTLVLVTL